MAELASISGSTMKAFTAPSDAPTYIRTVRDRCEDLVQYGIWGGVQPPRLRQWWANFTTETETYFAACILDCLIYRSDAQTLSLLGQMFQRTLPDHLRSAGRQVGHWWELLDGVQRGQGKKDPKIRFVGAVTKDDPMTKSAHIISRFMKRNFRIDEEWIIYPEDVKRAMSRGAETFIFFDDFLGTGQQFGDLVLGQGLAADLNAVTTVYMPLAGHTTGIKNLATTCPLVPVVPVEQLGEVHDLFNPLSNAFADGTNTAVSAKEFYYGLLQKYGIGCESAARRGYGHLGLAYVFEHAAPDNSLPLLWWADSLNWKPLFDR